MWQKEACTHEVIYYLRYEKVWYDYTINYKFCYNAKQELYKELNFFKNIEKPYFDNQKREYFYGISF